MWQQMSLPCLLLLFLFKDDFPGVTLFASQWLVKNCAQIHRASNRCCFLFLLTDLCVDWGKHSKFRPFSSVPNFLCSPEAYYESSQECVDSLGSGSTIYIHFDSFRVFLCTFGPRFSAFHSESTQSILSAKLLVFMTCSTLRELPHWLNWEGRKSNGSWLRKQCPRPLLLVFPSSVDFHEQIFFSLLYAFGQTSSNLKWLFCFFNHHWGICFHWFWDR